MLFCEARNGIGYRIGSSKRGATVTYGYTVQWSQPENTVIDQSTKAGGLV